MQPYLRSHNFGHIMHPDGTRYVPSFTYHGTVTRRPVLQGDRARSATDGPFRY